VFQFSAGGQALLLNKNILLTMASINEINLEMQSMGLFFVLNLNPPKIINDMSIFAPIKQQDFKRKLENDQSDLARLNFKLSVINSFKSQNGQYAYFVYTFSTQGTQILFTFLISR
jgi:hypothetical protein